MVPKLTEPRARGDEFGSRWASGDGACFGDLAPDRKAAVTRSAVVSRMVVYLCGSKPFAKRAFHSAVASERLAAAIGGFSVGFGLRIAKRKPRNLR